MPPRLAPRLLSLLLLLAAPGGVLAQEVQPPAVEEAPSPTDGEAPAPGDEGFLQVVLTDGQVLRGRMVRRDATSLQLALAGGGVLTVPAAAVRSLRAEPHAQLSADGEVRFADPSGTRYFYSPSARMLRKGEASFSQKELFFSSLAYGVTDNVSVLVGSIAPLWFSGTGGINFILGAKVGGEVAPGVHLAAGAESLMLPGLGTQESSGSLVGLAFGTVTVGGRDANLSLSAGKPLVLTQGAHVPADLAVVTVSGSLRVGRHVALMTENWLLPSLGSGVLGTGHGVGVRLMSERLAVDVGGVFLGVWRRGSGGGLVLPFPVPWLAVTYAFR